MINDILSVIFLALVCIVTSALVSKLAPMYSGLIVPSAAFICISLWISYDYILTSRQVLKSRCPRRSTNEIESIINEINTDTANGVEIDTDEEFDDEDEQSSDTPHQFRYNQSSSPYDPANDIYADESDLRTGNPNGTKGCQSGFYGAGNRIQHPDYMKPDPEPRPTKQAPGEFDIDIFNGHGDMQKIFKETGTSGDTSICNRMKYMGLQAKLSQDIRAQYNTNSLKPYVEEELREGDRIWWEAEDDTYGVPL